MQGAGNSRRVTSNQTGVHENLVPTVENARQATFKKPIASFNQAAFAHADLLRQQHSGDLILDSGCGVGESTCRLAEQFPEALVLGLDRSGDRLSRRRTTPPDNAHFIRTDLVDFWRLAASANWRLKRHYLLYPNPYPKKQALKQRWHGHPVFPQLVALGGYLECRSNWSVYLEELAVALSVYDINAHISSVADTASLTPFEHKYRASGQEVWQLTAQLVL